MEGLEDYDAAMLPNSRSRQLTGWEPGATKSHTPPVAAGDGQRIFDDWTSVWKEVARARGTVYSPRKRVGD
ncbi:MAG: hypothetical protein OXF98_06190 [Rhodospirillaceae bacterium]|nr:hypothetical protein [Rhodospirillaceae bacterium]